MTTDVAKWRWRSAVASFVLPAALAVGSALLVLVLTLKPSPAGPVAILFPPWWGAVRSMEAAAGLGSIIRLGAFPFVVIVKPDASSAAVPKHPSGALLLLDPVLFGGCTGSLRPSGEIHVR